MRHSTCPNHENNLLCITDDPVIQPFYFAKNLKVGQKTSILCLASGTEPFQFTWTKNGLPITSTHIGIQGFDVSSTLTLKPIKKDDGEYACLVKNPVGSASHSAVLSIERELSYNPGVIT